MKQCVIFAAYPMERPVLLPSIKRENRIVIAADGGLSNAEKCGVSPDLVIGDFDSLLPQAPPDARRVPAEKDDTDTMLCIKEGLKQGARDFLIYGGVGGRLSHTLANLQALVYLKQNGASGRLIGDHATVCYLENEAERFHNKGGYLSVLVYSATCRVTLTGFRYPLDRALLDNRFPLGVSNFLIQETGVVSVEDGGAFVIEEEKDGAETHLLS